MVSKRVSGIVFTDLYGYIWIADSFTSLMGNGASETPAESPIKPKMSVWCSFSM